MPQSTRLQDPPTGKKVLVLLLLHRAVDQVVDDSRKAVDQNPSTDDNKLEDELSCRSQEPLHTTDSRQGEVDRTVES